MVSPTEGFVIKRFIIAFIVLVIIVGGLVGFNLFRDKAIEQFFAGMKPPALTVSAIEVQPITWEPGIPAIGTVAASQGVDLTVETTGIVDEILFNANERVEQGKILVQLDDAVERADLNAVEAQAKLDQQSLQRAEELQKRGVSSQVAAITARGTASASAALAATFKAVLDQKQVRAPFSGTMGIPRVDNGQFVTPGTVIATIQDLETMRIDFTIPEQRFSELKIGQRVIFGMTDEAMPFSGTITGIDPKVDPVTRLVSVRAKIDNPEGRLNPGQFLQVEVKLPREEGVLAVPQTALVTSLYGDYIFVVRKEATEGGASDEGADADGPLVARQIFVKARRRSSGLVEISEGLNPGDLVVTAGQNRLSNGSAVTVDNTVTPERTSDRQAQNG
jgi:membrane fusion protein (multidrug efflux system)